MRSSLRLFPFPIQLSINYFYVLTESIEKKRQKLTVKIKFKHLKDKIELLFESFMRKIQRGYQK